MKSADEIFAPLGRDEKRHGPVTISSDIRPEIRILAIIHGVDFYENRQMLESQFTFRGSSTRIEIMKESLAQIFNPGSC